MTARTVSWRRVDAWLEANWDAIVEPYGTVDGESWDLVVFGLSEALGIPQDEASRAYERWLEAKT